MRYLYFLLIPLLVACASEEEATDVGNTAPTEAELKAEAKEIADKALDLTGAGISEIEPMEVGEADALPENLNDSYIVDYLESEGFSVLSVDDDIVPPNESVWISIHLSDEVKSCDVSKFYKQTGEGITVTEGIHCSLLNE